MSIFLLNKILYRTDNDAEFRRRMRENAEEVVRGFPLAGDELEALVTGDVGRLYRMGVHKVFFNHLSRYELFGVNRENYLDRIRDGMEYDKRFEQGDMPVQYVPRE